MKKYEVILRWSDYTYPIVYAENEEKAEELAHSMQESPNWETVEIREMEENK